MRTLLRLLRRLPKQLRHRPSLSQMRVCDAELEGVNDERVIATLALIPDSAVGLPMDAIYRGEIARLRCAGRRIAEVGALCIAHGHRRIGVGFLLHELVWRYARETLKVDHLLIVVHPDAKEIYKAAILVEDFGAERSYPGGPELRLAAATQRQFACAHPAGIASVLA